VLVYDFGGGTFDAAMVRFGADGRFEVLGHGALDDCGGRDIDAVLSRHVRETGGPELAASMSVDGLDGAARRMAALRLRLHLADFVRSMKHQLSDATEVEDYINPTAPPSRIRRSDLARLVAPTVARTVDCCHDLLRRTGVSLDEVDAILLVGGVSRMPIVVESIESILRRPIRRAEDPELAVVLGAAAMSEPRVAYPTFWRHGEMDLRWDIGGTATVLRWLTGSGRTFEADQPLALVRTEDGALWRLLGPPFGGTLLRLHRQVGQRLEAGKPLLGVRVKEAPSPPPQPSGPPPSASPPPRSDPPPAPAAPRGWPRTSTAPRTIRHTDLLVTSPRRERTWPGAARLARETLSFSPDGAWLGIVVPGRGATVWDVARGTAQVTLDGPAGREIQWIGLGDDSWFATATPNRTTFWDTGTGTELKTVHHDVTASDWRLSADGTRFHIARHGPGQGIQNLDTATGDRTLHVRGPSGILAFARDARWFLTYHAYELCLMSEGDYQVGQYYEHKHRVERVALTGDGARLITGGAKVVTGWTTHGGKRLGETTLQSNVRDLTVTPDGHWLATAEVGSPDVRLWSTAELRELGRFTLGHPVLELEFSPDGVHLATRDATGSVALWRVTL